MPSLLPLSEDQRRLFREHASSHNPGIGLIDLQTGQIYLVVASRLLDGDHASLAEQALGIDDLDDARHLRGFVVGVDRGQFRVANNSGLNPYNNRMEQEIFEILKTTLMSQLNLDS